MRRAIGLLICWGLGAVIDADLDQVSDLSPDLVGTDLDRDCDSDRSRLLWGEFWGL